jgi:hypothetical protein
MYDIHLYAQSIRLLAHREIRTFRVIYLDLTSSISVQSDIKGQSGLFSQHALEHKI